MPSIRRNGRRSRVRVAVLTSEVENLPLLFARARRLPHCDLWRGTSFAGGYPFACEQRRYNDQTKIGREPSGTSSASVARRSKNESANFEPILQEGSVFCMKKTTR